MALPLTEKTLAVHRRSAAWLWDWTEIAVACLAWSAICWALAGLFSR